MRTIKVLAAAAAVAVVALAFNAPAQTQMMGGYGGGYGMGGYGGGYMMGPGYGGGYMMRPGYGDGYGMGPGMMYGYGPYGRSYHRGQAYRGKRLCWRSIGGNTGYYAACRK
jgi:hypothetical protein